MRLLNSQHRTILNAIVISLYVLSGAEALNAQQQESRPGMPYKVRKPGGMLEKTAINRVQPTYPQAARDAGADGPVAIDVVVDEAGKVISATFVSGHTLLKDAAIEAARGWTFIPTQLSGVPVKVLGTITFNFDLGSRGLTAKEIERYKEDIRANPKSAEAYYKLGELYVRLFRYKEAIEPFKQAIKLKRDYEEAHYGLAQSYVKQGPLEEAVKAYKQLIGIKPDSARAYYELGELFYMRDLNPLAIQCFRQVVRIKPDNADAYYFLGNSYTRVGRYGEAIEAFKQATSIEPDSIGRHLTLARAYLRAGDKEAALKVQKILEGLDKEWAAELLREINR